MQKILWSEYSFITNSILGHLELKLTVWVPSAGSIFQVLLAVGKYLEYTVYFSNSRKQTVRLNATAQSKTHCECSGELFVPRKFWSHWRQWQKLLYFQEHKNYLLSFAYIKPLRESDKHCRVSALFLEISWPKIHGCYVYSCVFLSHMNWFWDWRKRLYMLNPKIKVTV